MTDASGQAPAPRADHQCWKIEPARHVVLADGRRVTLRPLAPGDGDLMAEFFAGLSAREIYYFFALDEAEARALAHNAGRDAALRLIALGEQAGGVRILGYMFLSAAQEGPRTFGACLRDGVQSAGLGRAMIDHLLTSAAASGIGQVTLTVHADNWRALRLYQRAGFVLTGEEILEAQGAKQYRMEVDLRLPRPVMLDDLTVVARGGIGVGVAAGRIQHAVEAAVGRRPLILDRPIGSGASVVFVVDLASPMERPFVTPVPDIREKGVAPAWIVTLDDHHLLVGGIGAAAVDRAAHAYSEMIAAHGPAASEFDSATATRRTVEIIPYAGIHRQL